MWLFVCCFFIWLLLGFLIIYNSFVVCACYIDFYTNFSQFYHLTNVHQYFVDSSFFLCIGCFNWPCCSRKKNSFYVKKCVKQWQYRIDDVKILFRRFVFVLKSKEILMKRKDPSPIGYFFNNPLKIIIKVFHNFIDTFRI